MKCPHCNKIFEKSASLVHLQVPVIGWADKFTSLCGVSSSSKTANGSEVDCQRCLKKMKDPSFKRA